MEQFRKLKPCITYTLFDDSKHYLTPPTQAKNSTEIPPIRSLTDNKNNFVYWFTRVAKILAKLTHVPLRIQQRNAS
jgi:hypothetical protein